MNPDTRAFLQRQMMWIGISLAISFAISRLLPFPVSLVTIILVFVGMNYFMRRRQMGRMGMGTFFGGPTFGSQRTVNYYCMNCGLKHNERSCPRCGSTVTRIG